MKECHYKDKPGINNQTLEKQNIQEISKKCDKALKSSDLLEDLKKELLKEGSKELKKSNPNHIKCDGCPTGRRTEKRICRCMYYYNNSASTKDCGNCKLTGKKWKNVGNIRVDNYEMPLPYIIKGVGGIDIILNYNGEKYGAEVKPWNSSETISRMIAETLTYNLDRKYKPAIAVFEKNIDTGKETYQYATIKKYKDTDEWKPIKECGVEIFVIYVCSKKELTEFNIEHLN